MPRGGLKAVAHINVGSLLEVIRYYVHAGPKNVTDNKLSMMKGFGEGLPISGLINVHNCTEHL